MTTLQRTQLYNEHVKLGGKIVPFAGFEMPVQYTSVKEEVLAVRNGIGVFDVGHMGEFFVEGDDAVDFVDHLVTNDIKNAGNNKAIYSPLCRENGTVIDDLIVYKLAPKKILICVNASNMQKDWNWISTQAKNWKCTVRNETDNYSLLAVQGPQTEKILKQIEIIKNPDEFVYYSAREVNVNGETIIAARTGYTGEDGFEIFCSHSFVKTLWSKLMAAGATPCGLGSRDVLRVEVCYPLYGHEIHDDVTPLDAGLKWTVKLDKTNFIGKSALVAYKPKYKLVKLILDKGIPREQYPVENANGERIGHITSGTMSVVTGKGVAMAHIEINKVPMDNKYLVNIRNTKYEATLTNKAFVTGGHK